MPEIIKTPVQIPEEFQELFNPIWRYIVFYGGRGGLKSHSVARSLLLRGRAKKLRILCTREIQRTILDSVHALLKDIIAKYKFNDYIVNDKVIRNTVTGTEFIFAGLRYNVTEIKSMEGIDICWVEEAQTTTEDSLNILTPTIRKPGSQIIFTFNRVTELDPVYVRFVMNQTSETYVRKVNYDVAEKLGWLPDVLKIELEEDRKNPSLFAHKWLGEPLGQADMCIIPRDMILNAMKRTADSNGQVQVGVDVARFGDDRTVFFKRKGFMTLGVKIHKKLRTTQICDALEEFINYDKATTVIKIDDTGVGGGVTDEMIKRGYKVVAINFGGEPENKDKYPNWISEAWFRMAEIMPDIALPFDSNLLMELANRLWKQDNHGRRMVESKQEYKKRGFKSPDIADAAIIAFSQPRKSSGGSVITAGNYEEVLYKTKQNR